MSTRILSCTTLLEYVRQAQQTCGTSYPVTELDRTYHEEPEQMRQHILDTLAAIPEEVDTVLIAMGFCGGSWQDISCDKTIVIPRIADCVALALTTPEEYAPDLKQNGHMYIFGEGDNGFSIRAVYDDLRKKHDPTTAECLFNMYFEHYYHVDIIDNGLYDCYDPDYVERVQEDADRIGAEVDFVPGSNALLEALVSGRWDERFVIVPPGRKLTQSIFYDIR